MATGRSSVMTDLETTPIVDCVTPRHRVAEEAGAGDVPPGAPPTAGLRMVRCLGCGRTSTQAVNTRTRARVSIVVGRLPSGSRGMSSSHQSFSGSTKGAIGCADHHREVAGAPHCK